MTTTVVLERRPLDPGGNTLPQASPLTRQRVYIFPTSQGWVFGLMLFVMLLGAINYNNSMAYALCFLLTGLGLVCLLHTYRNLTGLIISSKQPQAVFAGEPALFPINIDNRLGIARLSLTFEQHISLRKRFRNKTEPSKIIISVDSGKQKIIHYPRQTFQRGLLSADRIRISSQFPLGIFSAWSYFEPDESCLVYPAPRGNKQLPLSLIENENADYGLQSGTDDFSGFKKYRPGDAINSIAWKAFAREKGLLIKQFSGKGSQMIMLDWEAVAILADTEARLSQLCLWVILADETAMHYGLSIPGSRIDPDTGEAHKERCLKVLARYGLTS